MMHTTGRLLTKLQMDEPMGQNLGERPLTHNCRITTLERRCVKVRNDRLVVCLSSSDRCYVYTFELVKCQWDYILICCDMCFSYEFYLV